MLMSQAQLIGLVVSILLTGFFSGISVAFGRTSKLNLEIRKRQGRLAGKLLSRFAEQPTHFIATGLVGFTIMTVIYCVQVGVIIREQMDQHAVFSVLQNPYLRLFLEVVLAFLIMLFFGLLIPRSLFRARAERILAVFVIPIWLFDKIFHPLAIVMTDLANWILKYLFNVRLSSTKQVFTIGDPEHFIAQMQQVNDNSELNTELFENALTLPHIKVRQCLIPRKEVEGLELSSSIQEAAEAFVRSKLSKLIIYSGSIDDIQGYIHQLDLFKNPATIHEILHPILAVPETMSANDLLKRFTEERKSIAWVVDEFGGTAGIVTLEDLLEEIFGDIKDEHDVEEFVQNQIAEKEFIFSGRMEIDYLNETYDFGLPVGDSETLSGLLIAHHETIPKVRDRIIIGEFEFEVLSVNETRVDLVKMRILS